MDANLYTYARVQMESNARNHSLDGVGSDKDRANGNEHAHADRVTSWTRLDRSPKPKRPLQKFEYLRPYTKCAFGCEGVSDKLDE